MWTVRIESPCPGTLAPMASEMRTTPDFILDQPRLQFAAHIKGSTPHAVSIPISPITDLPQLDVGEYADMIERNRARVSLGTVQMAGGAVDAANEMLPDVPDEDISKEW